MVRRRGKTLDVNTLNKGDKVSYGFYSNLTFLGILGNCVRLQDNYGNTKDVFIELFEKHGRKITN